MLNKKTLHVALAQQEVTLKEVASRTGLDLLRLYRISRGVVDPRSEEIQVIADFLGIVPDDLVSKSGVGLA